MRFPQPLKSCLHWLIKPYRKQFAHVVTVNWWQYKGQRSLPWVRPLWWAHWESETFPLHCEIAFRSSSCTSQEPENHSETFVLLLYRQAFTPTKTSQHKRWQVASGVVFCRPLHCHSELQLWRKVSYRKCLHSLRLLRRLDFMGQKSGRKLGADK